MTDLTHTDPRQQLQTLKDQLQQTLIPLDDNDDPTDVLRNQMRILHHICNRMLVNADRCDYPMMQYNLALRAQNQYRQTLLAIEALDAQGRK